jgi:hypothetical protein
MSRWSSMMATLMGAPPRAGDLSEFSMLIKPDLFGLE